MYGVMSKFAIKCLVVPFDLSMFSNPNLKLTPPPNNALLANMDM